MLPDLEGPLGLLSSCVEMVNRRRCVRAIERVRRMSTHHLVGFDRVAPSWPC